MSRSRSFYLVAAVAIVASLLVSSCGAPEDVTNGDGVVTNGDGVVTDGDGDKEVTEWVTMEMDNATPDRVERRFPKGAWVEGMKPGEEDIYYQCRQGGTGNPESPYTAVPSSYGWFRRWEIESKGHFQFLPGYGYLYSRIPEALDLVGSGVLEGGWCSSAYRPDRLPYGLLPGMGFWHAGLGFPERTLMIHYNAMHPLYHAHMRTLGLQSLGTTSGGWMYGFWETAKAGAPRTKAEFAGKLIRATSYLPALFEHFGMTPLLLTHPEYIEALQKGMIDMGIGWRIEPETGYSWLPEIITHVGVVPGGINDWTGQRFINASLWDGMPEYLRNIWTEKLYPEHIVAQAMGERMAHRNYELDWEEQGTIFYEIPPETMEEFYVSAAYAFNMFVTDLRERGVNVDQEITDMLRFRRLIAPDSPWPLLPVLEAEYGLSWNWETGAPTEPNQPWPSVDELVALCDQAKRAELPPDLIPYLEETVNRLIPENYYKPNERSDFFPVFD
jgi:hypothetical protein